MNYLSYISATRLYESFRFLSLLYFYMLVEIVALCMFNRCFSSVRYRASVNCDISLVSYHRYYLTVTIFSLDNPRVFRVKIYNNDGIAINVVTPTHKCYFFISFIPVFRLFSLFLLALCFLLEN